MKVLIIGAAAGCMMLTASGFADDGVSSGPGVKPAPGVGETEKATSSDVAGPNITASDPEKGSLSAGERTADRAEGKPAHGQGDAGNTATPAQDASGVKGAPDTRTGPSTRTPD